MAKTSETEKTWGTGGLFGNRSLMSLLLVLACPYFVLTCWHTCLNLDGSVKLLVEQIIKEGPFVAKVNFFNPIAWKIIFSYMAFELALMRLVPGKIFKATVTPSGHVPIYIANGVECYLISIATLFILAYTDTFKPSLVYNHMGDLLASMCVFAFFFCILLTVKGLYFPSTADSGTNGDIIVDFFWGTELYPRIFGFDVKQFTNCRFGMMYWQLGILCYAFKQYELTGSITSSMLVSVIIQTVYIAKFFIWETGYFCSSTNNMIEMHSFIQHIQIYVCLLYIIYLYILLFIHITYYCAHI